MRDLMLSTRHYPDVPASGKNLTTIYVTHGHGDHFFAIGALLDHFPNAKAVATPDVLKVMRRQISPEFLSSFWSARYPGQIPHHLVLPEELQGHVIDLEGRELVAVEAGHTDTDNTSIFTRHQSGWSSLATPPTTMFTSTSPSQTRKLAASGSLRSDRERLEYPQDGRLSQQSTRRTRLRRPSRLVAPGCVPGR
jgi:hypothetical protein